MARPFSQQFGAINPLSEILDQLPEPLRNYLIAFFQKKAEGERGTASPNSGGGGGGGWGPADKGSRLYGEGADKDGGGTEKPQRYVDEGFVGPPDKFLPVGDGGMGGRMSVLPSGPPGNEAALKILANRPGSGGYEGIAGGGGSGGGPEDMVRSAIMQHLRYLLQPDVSAPPMKPEEYWTGRVASEFPDLKYDTPLSNPRVAEAIGPLMEMYAGVGRSRQAERMGEQEIQNAAARQKYLESQARNLDRGGTVKSEIMKAASLVYNARKWVDTEILKAERDAANGIPVNIGGQTLDPSQAPEIIAAIKKNVADANELLDLANQANESGDTRAGNYYAAQAAAMLSEYAPMLGGQGGGGAATPAPTATGGANLPTRPGARNFIASRG